MGEVSGGAAVPIDGNTILTSTIIDIIVPGTYQAPIQMSNGALEMFPRPLILAHELFGHGLCGEGMCAVTFENELRTEMKLGLRTGKDHDGGDSFTSDGGEVKASDSPGEIIKIEPGKIQTNIEPRQIIPLPPFPKKP